MAVTNPPVAPTQDPNWDKNFKPAEVGENIKPTGVATNQFMPEGQKVGDTSANYQGEAAGAAAKQAGMGYQSFGDLFSGVVAGASYLTQVGDTMIKKDIENKVYDQANATREQFTQQLEQLKTQKGGGVGSLLDANASMPNPDGTVGGPSVANMPTELKGLPDQLDSLSNANDAGKLSGTAYWGRLLQQAKDLRTKYPGYVNYIDQQFAQVTGQNPANAYASGLMADLNKGVQSMNAEKNKMENFVVQRNAYPDADKTMQSIQDGSATWNSLFKWAGPQDAKELRQKNAQADFTETSNDRQLSIMKAGTYADDRNNTVVSNFLQNSKIQSPTGQPIAFTDWLVEAQAGHYKTEYVRQVAEQLRGQLTSLNLNLKKNMDEPTLAGKSPTFWLGQDVANQKRTAAVKDVKDMLDSLVDPASGAAFIAANHLIARSSDQNLQAHNDPVLGPQLDAVAIVRHNVGDNAMGDVISKLMIPPTGPDGKPGKPLIPALMDWTNKQKMGMAAQNTVDGSDFTLSKVMDGVIQNRQKFPELGKVPADTVDFAVKVLTNPKTDDVTKSNIVRAAFSEGNMGFLDKIEGIQGKQATFSLLTSPAVTKTMQEFKNSSAVGAKAWQSYVNWSESSFADKLLPRELADLKNLGPGTSIEWNPAQGQFFLNKTSPQGRAMTQANFIDQNNQKFVDRLNAGVASLYNIYKADGLPPEKMGQFMIQKLEGWQGSDFQNIKGIAGQLIDNIHNGEARALGGTSKSNFAEEKPPVRSDLPPIITTGQSTRKPVFNYSDEDVLGMSVNGEPVSQDYIRSLQTRRARDAFGTK